MAVDSTPIGGGGLSLIVAVITLRCEESALYAGIPVEAKWEKDEIACLVVGWEHIYEPIFPKMEVKIWESTADASISLGKADRNSLGPDGLELSWSGKYLPSACG